MKTMTLSEIWVYPIKSLGGISVQTARVFPKGLEHDRRWMLLDEKGMFMTQRHHPQMALFKLSTGTDHITVRYQGETLNIPVDEPGGTPFRTGIWKDDVTVIPLDPAYDKWFSERLGVDSRLVRFPEENPRPVEPGHRDAADHVRLQDAFPFLILGQASLDELNRRLATPVPVNRFRPNFVFTGGDPHEEDGWQNFTIGSLPFQGTRTCARCGIPGVDQETGQKQKEPLATLVDYRMQGNNIMFGMNAIGPGYGEVNVGDEVMVVVTENIP